jgi:rhodanese-related sulfurtransferase|tara:strand:- start:1004 stop:1498 length:495 start_codon:yes stop_codon:yes gene_type:complete
VKTPPLKQAFIIVAVSAVFAFSYNAVRINGLPLIAAKTIVEGGEGTSVVDSLLAKSTLIVEPMMIDLTLAVQLYERGVTFIDARDEDEFNQGHIAGSLNAPIIQLVSQLSPDDPLVTYCSGEGCDLSMELSETLMLDWQFTKVFIFDGGWPEWKAGGHPVEGGE